jgi:hypothetical protein
MFTAFFFGTEQSKRVMLCRSRSESALKGKVILHVDIQLTDDQSDRLSVRRGAAV